MSYKFDAHDDQERNVIQDILSQLPEGHPARVAHAEGADGIRLSRLVGDKELAERLTQVWLEGYNRMLRRHGHFKP